MNPIAPIIIYAYRLTDDTGCAPCIFDLNGKHTGVLTLACCKGGRINNEGKANEKEIFTGLRHSIGKDYKDAIKHGKTIVYLLGIYKNKLLYFAQVTEVITMAEYFAPNSKYRNRLDCIYDWLNDKFSRNDNNPKFHPKNDTGRHRRDWLGNYVLISNLFAYFGKKSSAIPQNLLAILPKGQDCKNYAGDSSEGKLIMDEVSKVWNFHDIIQNEPHEHIQNCGSNKCNKNSPV